MVGVMVNPLMEDLVDSDARDHRMCTATTHVGWPNRAYELHALATHFRELLEKIVEIAVAVVSRPRHLSGIPCHQRWLVLVEHRPDATGETSTFRLDEVTDALVDAPLVLGRSARRDLRRKRAEQFR